MRALIVEAVAAASPDVMRHQRDASRADLVELRLDCWTAPTSTRHGRPEPAGHRHLPGRLEGAAVPAPRGDRLAILARALALGADYVDLEWKGGRRVEQWPHELRARVVLSSHGLRGRAGDLADRVRDMRAKGPRW